MKFERFFVRSSACGAVAFALALGAPGCVGSTEEAEPPASVTTEELIAGFAANGAKLDMVASIGLLYGDPSDPYVYFEPYCSGSLIGPTTVLTAKHCTDYFGWDYDYGLRTYLAIGPDARQPKRYVEVVAVSRAPVDSGGFVGYGHDVGVMHLAGKVTNVTPLKLGTLGAEDVGKKFVNIGYGVQDNSSKSGTRRTGKSELGSLHGKVFELLFGSFEAFQKWYYTGTPSVKSSLVTGPVNPAAFLPLGRSISSRAPIAASSALAALPSPDTSAGGTSGSPAGGASGIGEGGAGEGGDGGGSDPDDWLREIYDTTLLLDDYEAVFGGKPGDAQVCYGDSGSPVVRADAKGQLVAYAVVSGGLGSRALICDFGGVNATFGPEVRAFLDAELEWVDPCDGLTVSGVCDGDTARRCTAPNEGKRRSIEFDCSMLGQICDIQPDGTAGCSDP